MNKEFIPYKLALKLKELGFNEECLGHYIGEEDFSIGTEQNADILSKLNKKEYTNAPLYQQAFRFFREKHGLDGIINIGHSIGNIYTYSIWKGIYENDYDEYFSIYEESELACLEKLIEIAEKL